MKDKSMYIHLDPGMNGTTLDLDCPELGGLGTGDWKIGKRSTLNSACLAFGLAECLVSRPVVKVV